MFPKSLVLVMKTHTINFIKNWNHALVYTKKIQSCQIQKYFCLVSDSTSLIWWTETKSTYQMIIH